MNAMTRLSLMVLCVFATAAHALERTDTGFYYPIGVSTFKKTGGTWLGRDQEHGGADDGYAYFDKLYHNGVDMITPDTDAETYAVADGTVLDTNDSTNSWGATKKKDGSTVPNSGVFITHYTAEGRAFTCLYGHIQRKVKKGDFVRGGDALGTTGEYPGGIHLHFGCFWGATRPGTEGSSDLSKVRGWGRMGNDWFNKTDKCTGRQPDTNCFVDPVDLIRKHRPATLIAKGEENVFHVAGYVLLGSDLCTSATSVHKITDSGADHSNYWVTEAVNQEEACQSIMGTIRKSVEEVQAHNGVIKASRLSGVRSAISAWLSKVSSVFHWIFSSEARAASLIGSDPAIQKELAVTHRARVYQIAGTDKRIVFLTDGPGMNGDKAINSTPYAELLGPLGPYDPKLGSGASGKKPDLSVDELWTERSNGQDRDIIPWGDTVCLAAKIKNKGSANPSQDVKVAFFLSKGEKEDKYPKPVGKENIKAKNLEKGEKKTEKHCLDRNDDDYPSYPGTFNFGVQVDPDNTIPESSKKNNYKGGRVFTLSEAARFSIASFHLSQTTPVAGTEVTVYLQVTNTGTPFHSDKVNIQYRIAGPQYGANPTLIGFDQIKRSNLRGGDVKTESIAFILPTTLGTYTLTAEIDYDQRTNQSDRSGHVGMLTFTIEE